MRLRWLFGDQVTWELCMIGVRGLRGEGWPDERGSDATIHACRAVVGTRLRWPDRTEAMLRHLQVLAHAGELLDDSDTLEIAAARAGLPVAELAAYCAEPEVQAALRADMAAAAGRPCGITEGSFDGLLPRADAESVEEVLRWAGMPLTAGEIAAICDRDVGAQLAHVARVDDGYWTL
jgi:hypothetical protein